jgi:glycosyltransferase involved in cell wall biosynthesis
MGRDLRSVRLSVLMPVYNERSTLEAAILRLHQVPLDTEIVCVDDGSSDGSREMLSALHQDGLIDVLVVHQMNQGKGTAVRTAVAHATGDVMVIQDADLEYDPEDLPSLLQPIVDGKADAVFGSRFLGGPHRVLYFWHRVGNGLLTLLSDMLTDLNLTDMETGYKMVRADLMRALPLTARRFGLEPELTARLAQAHARIYEVPISYAGRTYAEGKKIGWRDGVAAIWHTFRFNVFPPVPVRSWRETHALNAAGGPGSLRGGRLRDNASDQTRNDKRTPRPSMPGWEGIREATSLAAMPDRP